MKKFIFTIMLCIAASGVTDAEPFAPTLLKIEADPFIMYDFDGSVLEIPVIVSGTPAQVVFCVFTKDHDTLTGKVRNGNLGWHYVNNIDTCIYFMRLPSWEASFDPGKNTIVWDGRDQDGKLVLPGNYTYYLWEYDNTTDGQMATYRLTPYSGNTPAVLVTGPDGLTLTNPVLYNQTQRWSLGMSTRDAAFLETINLPVDSPWTWHGTPVIDTRNPEHFYVRVRSEGNGSGAVAGFRWIPDSVP